MAAVTILAVVAAVIWGVMWAWFLQVSFHGRFLAARMTWLSVVVGVGIDLVILYFVLPFEAWLQVCLVVAGSSIAIIIRSLVNEARDTRKYLQMKNERSRSTDKAADPK